MTLIVPIEESLVDKDLIVVGKPLVRIEVDELVRSYTFDLTSGTLDSTVVRNPNAGTKHEFLAYRLKDSGPDDELQLVAAEEGPSEAELELGENA